MANSGNQGGWPGGGGQGGNQGGSPWQFPGPGQSGQSGHQAFGQNPFGQSGQPAYGQYPSGRSGAQGHQFDQAPGGPGGRPPGGGGPGGPGESQGRPPGMKRPLLIGAAIFAVLALVVVGGVVALLRDDRPAPSFLAASDEGRGAFGQDFTTRTVDVDPSRLRDFARDAQGGVGSDSLRAEDAPGLYGASLDDNSCDVGALSEYFADTDSGTSAAFASQLGQDQSGLGNFLTRLTPVFLGLDTWVTYHQLDNGEVSTEQTVLSAGTPVLIDNEGLPRVRCAGANPLSPADEELASPSNGDAPWENYDSGDVVRVEPSNELAEVTFVDVDTGEQMVRALGSGRTGAIQVTLEWDGFADIDVHATDPSGTEIYYSNAAPSTGGELDVDACVSGDTGDCTATGNIENIFWSRDEAGGGGYSAWAEAYSMHDEAAAPYTLKVFVSGVLVHQTEGTFTTTGQTSNTLTFSHG